MAKKNTWTIKKILDTSSAYWQTCTLHAAVRLDIFTLLGEQSITLEEIIAQSKCNPRGISMLIYALVGMGLLLQKGDRYCNSPDAKKFLVKTSPHYIGYIILHHSDLVSSWAILDKAVQTGEPIRKQFEGIQNPENFLMGMHNLAMGIAPHVAKKISLSRYSHLLDLGGGPGTYAIHFCMNNPHLKASIFDLPTSRPFAIKNLQTFQMSERIDFISGNYLQDDIPGTYDVAWLSHILHAEGKEACLSILGKTVKALKKGGLILIHEFILNQEHTLPLFPALFSLNMLVNTPHGQAYTEKEICDMLASHGIKKIKRVAFKGPNHSGIIRGIV